MILLHTGFWVIMGAVLVFVLLLMRWTFAQFINSAASVCPSCDTSNQINNCELDSECSSLANAFETVYINETSGDQQFTITDAYSYYIKKNIF